ncbi:MAG: coenzyme F420 biosynthesis-associated protein, partial [Actinobacteria bacterium ATB1]|nr:coenzyme F420 biosynthesis-associated protein [Actinobacteria bacterium ATB1]
MTAAASLTGIAEEREAGAAIDWDLAERVAVRTCGTTGFSQTSNAVTMPGDLRVLTERAQALVEDFTGLRSAAGAATAEVIDRPGWIRANLAGFRHMLEPIAEKIAEVEQFRTQRDMPEWARSIGAKVLGLELGLLLGFVSQRVLGQYDLLLPEEAAGAPTGGVVYYVGPNIAGLEDRFGFQPSDFRLWIALHEVTHRTQFTAVPWLRSHFLTLVDESIGGLDPDPRRVLDGVNEIIARVRRGESPVGEEGLMGLFAGERQRATFERIQAMMTVLEGHGNFVMDALGAEHVSGQAYMSRVLSQRRQQGGIARLVLRLLGMEMKARQYEEGQRFLTAV